MSTAAIDYDALKDELAWLAANPDFEERPATIDQFLDAPYLNIRDLVRPSIRETLTDIFGDEVTSDHIAKVQLAIVTGGIGIGKTTFASIVLPYLVHWVLCLKDPQRFFGLLPGSRIAFMQMSTSEKQALEVIFGDVKARVDHSEWFMSKYPRDPKFTNQIKFPKDVVILPGDSAETTFEGYNILGGVLDEADSHKLTANKDYAEQGYTTISSRISSRFAMVPKGDGTSRSYGFMLVIGQMKSANGFASRKYAEFSTRDDAYAKRMSIWESLGWDRYLDADGERDSFFYDIRRKQVVPKKVAGLVKNDNLIEVPNTYLNEFKNNPEKALRDLAGYPPAVGDAFISMAYKIEEARDRWVERHGDLPSPIDPSGRVADWFRAPNTLRRVCHIDLAYSGEGDALGFALGHVPEVVEIDGELKPYIVFDLLYRVKAPSGSEVNISDFRRFVYNLRDDLGFRIVKATMDGFESTDTLQQFQRRRIETDKVSVDKEMLPYHDLREALYENRIEFPPYMVHLRQGDSELVEIAYKELSELIQGERKIDHPPTGSKDVADAMAGVTYTLMGDRTFHRKVVSLDTARQNKAAVNGYPHHHAYLGDSGMHAPVPPTLGTR